MNIGVLKKLDDTLRNNNIEVKQVGLYKQLKLNHKTFMISNSSHYYTIDNEGFRTEEISVRPSHLLDILEYAIQIHLNSN